MNDYYTDLGICYWLLTNGENGTFYKEAAIKADRSALFHKPNDSKALYNCSFRYYHKGDCRRGNIIWIYLKSTLGKSIGIKKKWLWGQPLVNDKGCGLSSILQ